MVLPECVACGVPVRFQADSAADGCYVIKASRDRKSIRDEDVVSRCHSEVMSLELRRFPFLLYLILYYFHYFSFFFTLNNGIIGLT